MKQRIQLLAISFFLTMYNFLQAQNVGIGTTSPAPSAQLDVSSTNKGLLPPRMTQTERNAISNPAAGLIIFNTTSSSLEIFDGVYWTPLVKGNTGASNVATRKLYGGNSFDFLYAIRQSNDGGYFMVGHSGSSNTGTLTGVNNTNAVTADMLIMKTDAAGNIEWHRLLGGINDDNAYSVSNTSDGGCIVVGNTRNPTGGIFVGSPGYGNSDGLVIKLSASGTVQWHKVLGGSSFDQLLSVQQTVDGGYIACGSSNSTNSGSLTGINNNGSEDGWIVKMDNDGNLQWQKLLGGIAFETLNSIVQTPDGGYVAVGYAFSSNTGTLLGVTNNGGSDVWIIKMDATGNLQWQKLLGGNSNDLIQIQSSAVQRTTDGGYIVGAYSTSSNSGTLTGVINNGGITGTSDYWIIKLDGFGNLQWLKLLGGSADEASSAIIQTADGGYAATGYSLSSNSGTLTGYTTNGNFDAWIIKMDNNGNLQWQKLLGGIAGDVVQSIVQINGGFALAGYSNSSGSGYLTGLSGNGGTDGWFFKLDIFGNTY